MFVDVFPSSEGIILQDTASAHKHIDRCTSTTTREYIKFMPLLLCFINHLKRKRCHMCIALHWGINHRILCTLRPLSRPSLPPSRFFLFSGIRALIQHLRPSRYFTDKEKNYCRRFEIIDTGNCWRRPEFAGSLRGRWELDLVQRVTANNRRRIINSGTQMPAWYFN